MELFKKTCQENGILWKADDCFRYLNEFPEKKEQLSLFE